SHNKRSEHWTVVKGNPLITNGSSKITLTENESIYIPKNAKHRIENPNEEIVVIIEVQIGDYIEEDDIIRYEDQYNRTSED
ncbi:MAG: cupin domain-containing protein, partial [SAR202 cluster bacterium]|nr:cupin domain-containing protein [SAR202 cluster bacterium]